MRKMLIFDCLMETKNNKKNAQTHPPKCVHVYVRACDGLSSRMCSQYALL